MKSLTFRPTEDVRRLLDAEMGARPGVTQSYLINEKLRRGFEITTPLKPAPRNRREVSNSKVAA